MTVKDNKDLTVIYLTVNKVPEKWAEYHRGILLDAIGNARLLSFSVEPIDFGENYIQDRPQSLSNIYWQMLRACKMTDTPFVAVAEDDTLYTKDHYAFRPDKEVVHYNQSHWSLFTWGTPIYSYRHRQGNYSMLAHRSVVMEALQERFDKYPDNFPDKFAGEIGRNLHEKNLGVTQRKFIEYYTGNPIINFNHDFSCADYTQHQHRKRLGVLRAYDIPYWGRADELVKKFI